MASLLAGILLARGALDESAAELSPKKKPRPGPPYEHIRLMTSLTSQAALCWPSGYNAKTEHHLTISRGGAVSLSGGRDAARVSLADLEVRTSLWYLVLPRSSFTVLYRRLCSVHTHLS